MQAITQLRVREIMQMNENWVTVKYIMNLSIQVWGAKQWTRYKNKKKKK